MNNRNEHGNKAIRQHGNKAGGGYVNESLSTSHEESHNTARVGTHQDAASSKKDKRSTMCLNYGKEHRNKAGDGSLIKEAKHSA